MNREAVCVAACDGVPDKMLRNLRVLALLERTQTLLTNSEMLKGQAAECMRMLEVVTHELLACTEMYRRDIVQVPMDATPIERCDAVINAALARLRQEQPEIGITEVFVANDGKAYVVANMKGTE